MTVEPTPPLLAARGLALAVGGRMLWERLDFAVQAGQCWGILGRNGTGKTSLLHVLAGIRPPATGLVEYSGRPSACYTPRALALRRGLLEQTTFDAFSSTVLETALVGRHPHLGRWGWESPEDEEIAWSALCAVGLGDFAQREAATLSGGERRRLALASLLTQDPHVLLLDEPLASLDLHQQVAMLDLLRERQRAGSAMVMVLHDLTLAARYCDHVILLDAEATRCGPADELLRPGPLETCFRHPIRVVESSSGIALVPG